MNERVVVVVVVGERGRIQGGGEKKSEDKPSEVWIAQGSTFLKLLKRSVSTRSQPQRTGRAWYFSGWRGKAITRPLALGLKCHQQESATGYADNPEGSTTKEIKQQKEWGGENELGTRMGRKSDFQGCTAGGRSEVAGQISAPRAPQVETTQEPVPDKHGVAASRGLPRPRKKSEATVLRACSAYLDEQTKPGRRIVDRIWTRTKISKRECGFLRAYLPSYSPSRSYAGPCLAYVLRRCASPQEEGHIAPERRAHRWVDFGTAAKEEEKKHGECPGRPSSAAKTRTKDDDGAMWGFAKPTLLGRGRELGLASASRRA